MNLEGDPVLKEAKNLVELRFAQARKTNDLSEVHDESHVAAVSTVAPVVFRGLARAQNLDESLLYRGARIAAITGMVHDVVRRKTEAKRHGPEGAAYLETLRGTPPWDTITETDFDLMLTVIANHEGKIENEKVVAGPFPRLLELYGEPIGSHPGVYESMVGHGVIVGDRVIEGSGPRIIERRSRFAGKERMKDGGELAAKGFVFPSDSPLAVLGESQVRLYLKNSLEDVPRWLVEYAENLYSAQYMLYAGLLQHFGFTEVQAAEYLLRRGFTGMDEGLVERIEEQHHLTGEFFAERFPRLAQAILSLPQEDSDLGAAAYSIVMTLIAPETAEASNAAILAYVPGSSELEYFDRWMTGIRSYKMGDPEMLDDLERSVLSGAKSYTLQTHESGYR